MARLLVSISAIVELARAAMILFDRRPRLGGWIIVLFLVPVTIVYTALRWSR